jgi:Spy/CpxP family protein refolding chaperone
MRKTMMATAFGLALSFGAVGVVSAQAPQQAPQRQEQRERGMRRFGPGRELLKGIALTADQKTRLQEMRKNEKPNAQLRKAMAAVRAARQRGDTAAARAQMQALRPQWEQQREREVAAIRSILTPEQQKQFDANVAEWKQHAAQRGEGRREGRFGGRDGQQKGAPSGR